MADKNNRRNLFERIFGLNRDKDTTKQVTFVQEVSNPANLTEAATREKAIQLIDENKIQEAINYMSNITTTSKRVTFKTDLASELSEDMLFDIYRQMDNDSVISAALDLFADNATQVNTKTGHVVSVESKDIKFQNEVNEFLWDVINADTESWNIARSIAKYGKVILDTKASNGGREWAFIEVDRPEYIQPLTYGQDRVKYYAVSGLANKERLSSQTNYFGGVSQETEIADKDRYISGFNGRKNLGKMTIETENVLTKQRTPEELYIRGGKSFLEGVIETWRMLSTLEDSVFISRLTKSKAFNLVTVNVGGSTNNKQAQQMLDRVKTELKNAETLDGFSERFQTRTAPIPANDFLFAPVKGDVGAVTIEQVGGDVGQQDLSDIEYLRNKLFAGLGVLKAYLGFEETTPGGLGDTTLTMLDERFTRKVKRLRASVAFVYKQIVEYYWLNSSVDRTIDNIPEFYITMGKLSSQEEKANRDELQANIQTANDILSLANAFPNMINEEKMFNYLFSEVIGIDPAKFDTTPEAKDIKVIAKQLSESRDDKERRRAARAKAITESLKNIPKKDIKKVGKKLEGFLEGTIKTLLKEADLTDLLKEYDIYLEDRGKAIPLYEALENRDLKQSLTEKTYKDLKNQSRQEDPERTVKSKKITGRYQGLDENNYMTFQMTAEDPAKNRAEGRPTSYTTKVSLKALYDYIKGRRIGQTDMAIVRDAIQSDIAVSCTCPAAKYWGMQWRGTQEDYSIDINNIAPTKLPPKQVICKHVITTLTILPFWANTIVRDLRRAGLLPNTAVAKKDKVTADAEEQQEEQREMTKQQRATSAAPQTIKKTKQTQTTEEIEPEKETDIETNTETEVGEEE